MLYISEDKRNKTQTINLTRGDDAVLEVSLKNINSEDFTLGKSDYLIFDVRVLPRKESKLLLHIESTPGSNRIVFRHDDTASLKIGEYSAEVQMMTSDGKRNTVWPKPLGDYKINEKLNRSNFILMPEVVYE